jgi:ParB family transcriptional regulator, chromosome partitioning protein
MPKTIKLKKARRRKPIAPRHQTPRSISGAERPALPAFGELKTIRVDKINPDPLNRPIDLTQARFQSTRTTIQERGLVEPVVVYEEEDGRYGLADGHLRVAVLREQGVKRVQALVYSSKPSELQLRVDQHLLNAPPPRTPFERADQIQRIVDAQGGNQAAVGRLIGESRKTVSQYLALQRIEPQLRAEIDRHNAALEDRGSEPLTFNHLYEIALAKTPDERSRLAQLAMQGASTKSLSRARLAGPPATKPDTDSAPIAEADQDPAGSTRNVTPASGGAGGHHPEAQIPSDDLPVVSVALGDYEQMKLDRVDWEPSSQQEVRNCIAVGQALARAVQEEPPSAWPKAGIRMTWKGRADADGDVLFVYRKGRVYMRLREDENAVRRKAIIIAAIYTGETLQRWE